MTALSRTLAAAALALAFLAPVSLFAASLESPEDAGMQAAGNGLFLDPALTAAQKARIPALVAEARARVEAFYGPLRARPKLVFCASAACYSGFGAIGLGYTDGSNLVISRSGLRPAIIAHELAHVELASRLGGFSHVLDSVPQWFDEGLAVFISGAEEYSESAWLSATHNGRDVPSLSELASVSDWIRLTGEHGENMQLTYGTAKREVGRWLGTSGPAGLRELLRALPRGEDFQRAYLRLESTTALAQIARP